MGRDIYYNIGYGLCIDEYVSYSNYNMYINKKLFDPDEMPPELTHISGGEWPGDYIILKKNIMTFEVLRDHNSLLEFCEKYETNKKKLLEEKNDKELIKFCDEYDIKYNFNIVEIFIDS